MNRLIAFCVIGLAAAGCASGAQKKSVALEVTEKAGIGHLRDVTQDQLQKAAKKNKNTGGFYAVNATGVATGLFQPTTNMSPGLEATALFALAFFAPDHPESYFSRMLVWMPASEATSPEDAMKKMRTIVRDAYAKALPDSDVQVSVVSGQGKKGYVVGGGSVDKDAVRLIINDPACNSVTAGKGCYAYIPSMEILPKLGDAPKVLGSGKAYVWDVSTGGANVRGFPFVLANEVPQMDGEARVQVLQRISANLPPWVFYYVSPVKTNLEYPLVVNQGQRLYFIEPSK